MLLSLDGLLMSLVYPDCVRGTVLQPLKPFNLPEMHISDNFIQLYVNCQTLYGFLLNAIGLNFSCLITFPLAMHFLLAAWIRHGNPSLSPERWTFPPPHTEQKTLSFTLEILLSNTLSNLCSLEAVCFSLMANLRPSGRIIFDLRLLKRSLGIKGKDTLEEKRFFTLTVVDWHDKNQNLLYAELKIQNIYFSP